MKKLMEDQTIVKETKNKQIKYNSIDLFLFIIYLGSISGMLWFSELKMSFSILFIAACMMSYLFYTNVDERENRIRIGLNVAFNGVFIPVFVFIAPLLARNIMELL